MKKVVVVFIHGLKGGESTWVNDEQISFKELLESNRVIKDECEIIEYDYFTQITEFMNGFISKQSHAFMKKLPIINRLNRFKKTKKVQKNKSISDLSKGLESFLRATYKNQEDIILIGHSMGGLVAKNLIIDQIESGPSINISGYISIATPHKGSLKSLFIQFSSNEHIQELKPLNKQTLCLDEKWGKYKNELPRANYLIALDDEVVESHTAKPDNIANNELYYLDKDDHTSICKPPSNTSLTFTIVKDFIIEVLNEKKTLQI